MHASARGCCLPQAKHHKESFVSFTIRKKREVARGGMEPSLKIEPPEIKTKVRSRNTSTEDEESSLRMGLVLVTQVIPAE